MVNDGDKNKSKVQFDETYQKIHDDAMFLIKVNFGASKEKAEENKGYLGLAAKTIIKDILDIGTYIRIANSIFPTSQLEAKERRTYQQKAIGLCFDILTKYKNIMKMFEVRDDKYVEEIKHLVHEINCLKRWKKSDDKRFADLP